MDGCGIQSKFCFDISLMIDWGEVIFYQKRKSVEFILENNQDACWW